jgi:hypothetical protein
MVGTESVSRPMYKTINLLKDNKPKTSILSTTQPAEPDSLNYRRTLTRRRTLKAQNFHARKQSTICMLRKSTLKSFVAEDLDKLVSSYLNYNNKIKWIDIFSCTIDIITIYALYFDHFDYINNNYTLTSSSNLIRLALLAASILIVVGIILRFIFITRSSGILLKLGHKSRTYN